MLAFLDPTLPSLPLSKLQRKRDSSSKRSSKRDSKDKKKRKKKHSKKEKKEKERRSKRSRSSDGEARAKPRTTVGALSRGRPLGPLLLALLPCWGAWLLVARHSVTAEGAVKGRPR